ncbi:hypothetical protein [Paenibacillus sp. y28]|uniref:hypothetical protein n=1 Tax=Paenibacillus sp. y28 TaxID=3129110 RepID=UPI003019DF46
MNPEDEIFQMLLQQGCNAWRAGDDHEGIGWFQQACLEWLDYLEQAEPDGSGPSESLCTLLAEKLEQVLQALNGSDIIRATDVIEMELIPLLSSPE